MEEEIPNFDFNKIKFGDVEGYRGNNDIISFNLLVLKQIQKISGNANHEFVGGYWQQKVIPMQGGTNKVTEEYIPDTREIYSNSIDFLHDLILPYFIKEDSKKLKKARERMLKASEDYQTKIDTMLKEFMKDGKFTDEEKTAFREERVKLCRKLLQEMSIYLEKENYFSGESN